MSKITHCVSNYTLCVKLHIVCQITHCVSNYTQCVKVHTLEFVQNYTICAILNQFLSRIHWKILHLTEFFTQPAVVMVVTNMKCVRRSENLDLFFANNSRRFPEVAQKNV